MTIEDRRCTTIFQIKQTFSFPAFFFSMNLVSVYFMIRRLRLKQADHNVPHKATVTHLFSCFCVYLQHWLNIKRVEQHLENTVFGSIWDNRKVFLSPPLNISLHAFLSQTLPLSFPQHQKSLAQSSTW